MKDEDKKKEQLIQELIELRQQIAKLKKLVDKRNPAKQELPESRQRYQEIVENINEIVYEVATEKDPCTAKLQFVSSHVENIIGYRADEFLLDPELWFRIIDPQDRQSVIDSTQKIMTSRKPGIREYRLVHKQTGERRWMEDKVVPNLDGLGNIKGFWGVAYDITERKRMEDALRGSEASLSEAQRIAHLGSWDWDMLSNNVHWSDETYRIFGLKVGELKATYESFLSFVHPDDRKLVSKSIENALNDRLPYSIDFRILREDGSERIVHDKGEVTYYESGKPLRMTGTILDITECKRAEEALKKISDSLKEAQRLAKVGSWEWDIINKKAYHSDELLRILGRTEDEFDGTFDTFLSFVHPDDRNKVQQVINEAFSGKGKGIFSIEYRLIRPDGTVCIVHDEGKIYFDDSGTPIRMVGSKQDITANKRIEEELLKAVKLEALGVLAGGIAHDFNNILTAILGNISLAKIELNPNDQIFKILNESEKASLRAKSLTDQLLTFSKGGAPVMKIVSLRELIPDWCHFALMGGNVRADIFIPENLWNVEIDEGQMQQVFHNLVINACQAMPQGGVINVQAENVTVKKAQRLPLETGRYVKISILDNGIGIPEKHLTKIFDPFFTTKQSGSGLGLSTTYSIMKRHLGHIQVESEIGVGTTFHLYLPASDEDITTVGNLEDKGLHKGSERILLMDDEEIIRDFAATALKHFGYEVELASDGTEAIELYKRSIELGLPFSAAILDLTIPGGMGGEEAIKEILKIDPDAKVIVSSGYSKDPIMADYKNHGFKGILTKPYKSSDLDEIIKRVIEKSDE